MEVVGTPTPELLKKICSEHVSEGVKEETPPCSFHIMKQTTILLFILVRNGIFNLTIMTVEHVDCLRMKLGLGGWRWGQGQVRLVKVHMQTDIREPDAH